MILAVLPLVDEIVDDHPPLAVADDLGVVILDDARLALFLVVIAGNADGLDEPDLQLPRHDARRYHAAARDGDDALPVLALLDQPPRQRLAVAVELIP